MKPFNHGINTIKTAHVMYERCIRGRSWMLHLSVLGSIDRANRFTRPDGRFAKTELTVRQDRTDCSPWPDGLFARTSLQSYFRNNNLYIMNSFLGIDNESKSSEICISVVKMNICQHVITCHIQNVTFWWRHRKIIKCRKLSLPTFL